MSCENKIDSEQDVTPCSALLEVPFEHRAIVQKIIERPRFLRRLLIEVAEKSEAYAAPEHNETRWRNKKDDWGNSISISQDCRAKARFYRRVAAALELPPTGITPS